MALLQPELAKLHQSAYYLARDADEARELAHQACIRAFAALHTFKPEAALRPWLQRILRNLFVDRRKSAAVRHEVATEAGHGPQEAVASAAASPLEVLLQRERAEALTEHIRAMPPSFQEVLVLCDIQELSYEEVCTITGLALGTVKSRLSRGRALLRERLLEGRELSVRARRKP